LKDLSETKNDDYDNVLLVLRKRKVDIQKQASPTPKKARVTRATPTAKKPVIPSKFPRRLKTRATKANPKIIDKEWAPPKATYKEWTPPSPPSSSSSEITHDALI